MKCEHFRNLQCKKGFAAILILGIVFAVLVLGAIVYLKQTQKPQSVSSQITTPNKITPQQLSSSAQNVDTANWKTYADAKYSYTFSYPPELGSSFNHVSDYSFEEWQAYENGPGVTANVISFDVYANPIRADAVRATIPQERTDYEKLLSLKQGDSYLNTGGIGFNCTTYMRGPTVTINSINWVSSRKIV